jgi:bacterioferritin (cytochrome b1)
MKKLAAFDRDKVIDLLQERLAFERTAVALHDALLAAIRQDVLLARGRERLAAIRAEEHEHVRWLEHQLRGLGAEPGERTHLVRLSEAESSGLVRAVLDEGRAPADLVHTLLAAELLDHAGWNALAQLASEAHDEEAYEELRRRLHEESEHLSFLRTLATVALRREVFKEETDVRRKAA